jgi:site-specific recombinase XerD
MANTLNAENTALHNAFLTYQKVRLSKQGYNTLKKLTRGLLRWFEDVKLDPLLVEIRDIMAYKAALSEKTNRNGDPVCIGTIRNYLRGGRALFRFLVMTGKRDSNPFLAIDSPRRPEHISRNVLSESHMNLLLQELGRFNSLQLYKVHVITELLYAAGLRISEAANLLPIHIDTVRRVVQVHNGKGGKNRTAFLTAYAAAVLELFLRNQKIAVPQTYRGKLRQNPTVFGVESGRLQQDVNDTVKETCHRLGIPEISSHGFRHSLGTHLLRAGCDIRHIQAILGHDKLETTQVYTHVDKEDIKLSLDTYHPRQECGICS